MEESLFPSGSLIESVQDGRTSELERERICFRGKNFIFLGPSLGLSYESFIYIFFLTIFIANYSTNYCLIGLFINRFIKFFDFDIINVIF